MARDYRYTIRIPAEAARSLSELADLHKRSLNREIQAAIESWTTHPRDPERRAEPRPASEAASGRISTEVQEIIEQVSQPETQQMLARLADPTVRAYVKELAEEAAAWSQLSAQAFQRDWASEEDSVYDDLQ